MNVTGLIYFISQCFHHKIAYSEVIGVYPSLLWLLIDNEDRFGDGSVTKS